jgi:hypothetical protein
MDVLFLVMIGFPYLDGIVAKILAALAGGLLWAGDDSTPFGFPNRLI